MRGHEIKVYTFNSLHTAVIKHASFCRLLISYTFSKKYFKSNSLDPYEARLFIRADQGWVQTVCKVYQQTTLVGKELNNHIVLPDEIQYDYLI